MKKHFTPQTKSHLIAQSRQLVEARYNFTLWEMRLFIEVLEQIKKEDEELKRYRVYYKDLIREYGENKKDYKYIRKASIRLLRKVAHFDYVNEKGQERTYHTVLFTGADTPRNWQDEEEDMFIDFAVNGDLKEQLIQLKSNYLLYDKRHILRLKSKFSVRIYQLLKSHEREAKDTVIVEYEVKILREMLLVDEDGNPNNQYKDYHLFKKRVLLQAQKELKEHTDIAFSFDEIKKGRRIDRIRFFVKKNRKKGKKNEVKQLDLELQEPIKKHVETIVKRSQSPIPKAPQPQPVAIKKPAYNDPIYTNPAYQELIAIGISQPKALELAQKHECNFVLKTISRANQIHQEVPKKNVQGFIITCIEQGTYKAQIEYEEQQKAIRIKEQEKKDNIKYNHEKIMVHYNEFEIIKKAKIEELKAQLTEEEKQTIITCTKKNYKISAGNKTEKDLMDSIFFGYGIEEYFKGTEKFPRIERDFFYYMEKIYDVKCYRNETTRNFELKP